ncbi:hypothetical protein BGW80DRAFT_1255010 [Lactifluus volemus]|nr:hypothetical protein BGW80DRAFT_1255010 [Lactifluus volemus]
MGYKSARGADTFAISTQSRTCHRIRYLNWWSGGDPCYARPSCDAGNRHWRITSGTMSEKEIDCALLANWHEADPCNQTLTVSSLQRDIACYHTGGHGRLGRRVALSRSEDKRTASKHPVLRTTHIKRYQVRFRGVTTDKVTRRSLNKNWERTKETPRPEAYGKPAVKSIACTASRGRTQPRFVRTDIAFGKNGSEWGKPSLDRVTRFFKGKLRDWVFELREWLRKYDSSEEDRGERPERGMETDVGEYGLGEKGGLNASRKEKGVVFG